MAHGEISAKVTLNKRLKKFFQNIKGLSFVKHEEITLRHFFIENFDLQNCSFDLLVFPFTVMDFHID